MTSARSSLRATGLSGPATARVPARAFSFELAAGSTAGSRPVRRVRGARQTRQPFSRFASSLATTRAANFPNVCIVLPPFIAENHRMKGRENVSYGFGEA